MNCQILALLAFLRTSATALYLNVFVIFISQDIKHEAYKEAIDTLGQISTMYSPMEKIDVLMKTFDKIHEVGDDDVALPMLMKRRSRSSSLDLNQVLPVKYFQNSSTVRCKIQN